MIWKRTLTIFCGLFILSCLASGAGRQEATGIKERTRRSQPQRIGIYPPPHFYADIWTDSDYYYIGDSIKIFFTVSEDAYVYIFDTDTIGDTHLIFPNYHDRDNFLRAGITYYIPDYNYDLKVTGPPGREQLTLIAVKRRFPFLERYHHFRPRDPFPAFPEEPERLRQKLDTQRGEKQRSTDERGLKIVPPPFEPRRPSSYYAEASTAFYVRSSFRDRRWPRNVFGRLFIRSIPTRAEIYIDDQYYGKTPKLMRLPFGTYEIRLVKANYYEWYETVRIESSIIKHIFARLNPRRYPLYWPNRMFKEKEEKPQPPHYQRPPWRSPSEM